MADHCPHQIAVEAEEEMLETRLRQEVMRPSTFAIHGEFVDAQARHAETMPVRHKRAMFALMRAGPMVTPSSFFPKHGATVGELTTLHVLVPPTTGKRVESADTGGHDNDNADDHDNENDDMGSDESADDEDGDGDGDDVHQSKVPVARSSRDKDKDKDKHKDKEREKEDKDKTKMTEDEKLAQQRERARARDRERQRNRVRVRNRAKHARVETTSPPSH